MMNVVIADDEKICREGLRDIIDWQSLGMQVVFCAVNGLEALEYITAHPVDLLVTDIRMPKMDGLELLQHLASQPNPPATLILSGFNDFSYAQHAIKYGVIDYFLKPIRPAAFVETLQKVAEKQYLHAKSEPSQEQYARFQTEDRSAATLIIDRMSHCVCMVDSQAAQACCNELYALFLEKKYTGSLFRKYAFRCIYQCVNDAEQHLGADIFYFNDMQPMNQLASAKDYPQVLEQLQNCIALLCTCVEELQSGQKKRIANEVDLIIRYRYADLTLSIASIAQELNLTPNYLSSLYKKQTGQTFSDYLENFRMQKAAEFLSDVRFKIYEAASLAGYADAKHFAKVFKSHYGITPNTFRQKAGRVPPKGFGKDN